MPKKGKFKERKRGMEELIVKMLQLIDDIKKTENRSKRAKLSLKLKKLIRDNKTKIERYINNNKSVVPDKIQSRFNVDKSVVPTEIFESYEKAWSSIFDKQAIENGKLIKELSEGKIPEKLTQTNENIKTFVHDTGCNSLEAMKKYASYLKNLHSATDYIFDEIGEEGKKSAKQLGQLASHFEKMIQAFEQATQKDTPTLDKYTEANSKVLEHLKALGEVEKQLQTVTDFVQKEAAKDGFHNVELMETKIKAYKILAIEAFKKFNQASTDLKNYSSSLFQANEFKNAYENYKFSHLALRETLQKIINHTRYSGSMSQHGLLRSINIGEVTESLLDKSIKAFHENVKRGYLIVEDINTPLDPDLTVEEAQKHINIFEQRLSKFLKVRAIIIKIFDGHAREEGETSKKLLKQLVEIEQEAKNIIKPDAQKLIELKKQAAEVKQQIRKYTNNKIFTSEPDAFTDRYYRIQYVDGKFVATLPEYHSHWRNEQYNKIYQLSKKYMNIQRLIESNGGERSPIYMDNQFHDHAIQEKISQIKVKASAPIMKAIKLAVIEIGMRVDLMYERFSFFEPDNSNDYYNKQAYESMRSLGDIIGNSDTIKEHCHKILDLLGEQRHLLTLLELLEKLDQKTLKKLTPKHLKSSLSVILEKAANNASESGLKASEIKSIIKIVSRFTEYNAFEYLKKHFVKKTPSKFSKIPGAKWLTEKFEKKFNTSLEKKVLSLLEKTNYQIEGNPKLNAEKLNSTSKVSPPPKMTTLHSVGPQVFDPRAFDPYFEERVKSVQRGLKLMLEASKNGGKYALYESFKGVSNFDSWILGGAIFYKAGKISQTYVDKGAGSAAIETGLFVSILQAIDPQSWKNLAQYTGRAGFAKVGTALETIFSRPVIALMFAKFLSEKGRDMIENTTNWAAYNPEWMMDLEENSDKAAFGVQKALFHMLEPFFTYGLNSRFFFSDELLKPCQKRPFHETYMMQTPSGELLRLPVVKSDKNQSVYSDRSAVNIVKHVTTGEQFNQKYANYYISYITEKRGWLDPNNILPSHDDYALDRRKAFHYTVENFEGTVPVPGIGKQKAKTIAFQLTRYPVVETKSLRYFMLTPTGPYEVSKGETFENLLDRLQEMKEKGITDYNSYRSYAQNREKQNRIKLEEAIALVKQRAEIFKQRIKDLRNGLDQQPQLKTITMLPNHYEIQPYIDAKAIKPEKVTLIRSDEIVSIHPIDQQKKQYFAFVGKSENLNLALNRWERMKSKMSLNQPTLFVYSSKTDNPNTYQITGYSQPHAFYADCRATGTVCWKNGIVTGFSKNMQPIYGDQALLKNQAVLCFEPKAGLNITPDQNYQNNLRLAKRKREEKIPLIDIAKAIQLTQK